MTKKLVKIAVVKTSTIEALEKKVNDEIRYNNSKDMSTEVSDVKVAKGLDCYMTTVRVYS